MTDAIGTGSSGGSRGGDSGERGSGEHLAWVTYLFGATPASVPDESAPAESARLPSASIDSAPIAPASLAPASLAPTSFTSAPFAPESAGDESDLPAKRLHNFPTGELERLTPDELQQRMNEITARAEPELIVVEPETEGERSARAHNVSMHALARKGVSSVEMTELLRRRDLDPADVAFEVTRLEQVGLLNDAELAATLVMQMRERKGLGRSAVTAELRRRKLDASAIEEALADAYDSGDDELTMARELALKRAPQLRSLDPETARRRLGAFLMRKGYSGSIVSSAVAAALAPNHPSVRGPRFE